MSKSRSQDAPRPEKGIGSHGDPKDPVRDPRGGQGPATRRLNVSLPGSGPTSYPVLVGAGAWSQLGAWLPPEAAGVAVISDDRVWSLWGADLEELLTGAGLPHSHYCFPAGERSKTRETKAGIEDRLLRDEWGRDVTVVALGGGVVTDLAGFLAATYLRGVPFLSLPTTLLAMVDAAIGGKTGVDTPAGKNLVGAFHQPLAVICALETLATLPDAELDPGLVETVKHAMMADSELLGWLRAESARIRAKDPEVLGPLVARSAGVKASVVAGDERDHAARQILNFGHTIGHGIERASGFTVGHGTAVSVGMAIETDAAVRADLLGREVRDALLEELDSLGLPTRLRRDPPLGPDEVIHALAVDKKNRGGEVRYALPAEVGRAGSWHGSHTTALPGDAVRAALEAHL